MLDPNTVTIIKVREDGKNHAVVVEVDTEAEVYRAPEPGFNKATRKACQQWIGSRVYTMDFYRKSAQKANEMAAWIKEQRAPYVPTRWAR